MFYSACWLSSTFVQSFPDKAWFPNQCYCPINFWSRWKIRFRWEWLGLSRIQYVFTFVAAAIVVFDGDTILSKLHAEHRNNMANSISPSNLDFLPLMRPIQATSLGSGTTPLWRWHHSPFELNARMHLLQSVPFLVGGKTTLPVSNTGLMFSCPVEPPMAAAPAASFPVKGSTV